MARFKDIDLSLDTNLFNDVGTKEDLESIKTTLYNNLMISSYEIPFDSKTRIDLRNVIHQQDDFVTQLMIEDTIRQAVLSDKRIETLQDLSIQFDGDATYNVAIKVKVRVDNKTDNSVVLNVIISI